MLFKTSSSSSEIIYSFLQEPSLNGSSHQLNHFDAGSPDSTMFVTSSTPVYAS